MGDINDVLSLNNPVFRTLLFYNAILVVKMMAMSILTASQRFKNKAFANPEDASGFKKKPTAHEDVERVRRAHLNDLENITIYFAASLVYVLTQPNQFIAMNIIRAFTAARCAHTFVYVLAVPQPARAITFFIGYGITGYMAAMSFLHFF